MLHPNAHVRQASERLLAGVQGITLVKPSTHAELLRRMRDCDLVLSDSGGIQEEAPALGVPLLVLRDKTERPEGIACGNALLVGTEHRRIVDGVRRILRDPLARAAMSRRSFPYGNGRAGERIAGVIVDWLERKSLTRSLT
jgi:UDP-N-acetylglucosamine 2-epimerase (non-hydrolysing)